MTQVELAKFCGVSQATVAQWEKGVCFPKAAKLPALARALGCPVKELLDMAEARASA